MSQHRSRIVRGGCVGSVIGSVLGAFVLGGGTALVLAFQRRAVPREAAFLGLLSEFQDLVSVIVAATIGGIIGAAGLAAYGALRGVDAAERESDSVDPFQPVDAEKMPANDVDAIETEIAVHNARIGELRQLQIARAKARLAATKHDSVAPLSDKGIAKLIDDDMREPINCLSCGTRIPAGMTDCSVCGWSYVESSPKVPPAKHNPEV